MLKAEEHTCRLLYKEHTEGTSQSLVKCRVHRTGTVCNSDTSDVTHVVTVAEYRVVLAWQ